MPQSFRGGPDGREMQYNEHLSPRITEALAPPQSFWPPWETARHVQYRMATYDIPTIQLSLRPAKVFSPETVVRIGLVPSTGQGSAMDALASWQASSAAQRAQIGLPNARPNRTS